MLMNDVYEHAMYYVTIYNCRHVYVPQEQISAFCTTSFVSIWGEHTLLTSSKGNHVVSSFNTAQKYNTYHVVNTAFIFSRLNS